MFGHYDMLNKQILITEEEVTVMTDSLDITELVQAQMDHRARVLEDRVRNLA